MPVLMSMGCFTLTHNASCSLLPSSQRVLELHSHSNFGGRIRVTLTPLNTRVSKNLNITTCAAVGNGIETDTAVVEKPQLGSRFQVSRGCPAPLGATPQDGGVNFAIYSLNAVSATLCLISLSDLQHNQVTDCIPLDPLINKTGGVWHVFLKGDFKDMLYGYKFDGKFSPQEGHYFDSSRVVLDPYAKAVISRGEFGALGPDGNCWPQMAGMVPSSDDNEFDWEGDLPLKYPQKDLVIYEMHVRGFTKHESSKTKFPGTYLGVVEKLDHLKELGVNCVELMPCHEFNELEYFSYNSVLGDYKVNFWGYSTINFFSPMIRYSSNGIRNCGRDGINEMKFMIKEAHKRGIEVIMDVVFNHTAEGNEKGPIISFRGVDNSIYYMVAPKVCEFMKIRLNAPDNSQSCCFQQLASGSVARICFWFTGYMLL